MCRALSSVSGFPHTSPQRTSHPAKRSAEGTYRRSTSRAGRPCASVLARASMRVGGAEHQILYPRQAPGEPGLTRPVFSPGHAVTLPPASGDVSRGRRG